MEKKKTTKELLAFVEEIKRQWLCTIDALVDPLMIVLPDYTISKTNQAMARMNGSSVKAILGKKCYKVFAKKSKPCPGCLMKVSAKTKKPATFSLAEVDGDKFFEVTSQPILTAKGDVEGIVQVYHDRTDAKRLEAQLIQSEKLASIGLLAGGFAHEINNPLGGILVFSQMLLRQMPSDSPYYEDVKEIELATKRCKAIVESLLDFARQRPVDKKKDVDEDVDVVHAIESALRFGRVAPQGRMVDVKKTWKKDGVIVRADRNKMIQLFLNLIKNAFDAMPDGGELTLSVETLYDRKTKTRNVVAEVRDTGVGISAKHLKKIFDPFFTTKEPGEGTGLGLAICYGIAQDIGAKIEVESTLNVGSCFRVMIPLHHM